MEEFGKFGEVKQETDWHLESDEDSKFCLICSQLQNVANVNKFLASSFFSWSESKDHSSCPCASIHLNVFSVFVLKTILEYPEEECVNIFKLTGGDNPSDWIILCDDCLNLSAAVYQLQVQIKQLKRQLDTAQQHIRNKLTTNVRKHEHKSDLITDSKINPRIKIRNYFHVLSASENKDDDEYSSNLLNANYENTESPNDYSSDEWSPPFALSSVSSPGSKSDADESETEKSSHSKKHSRSRLNNLRDKKRSRASKLKRRALSNLTKRRKVSSPKPGLRKHFCICEKCGFKSRSEKRISRHQLDHQLLDEHVDTSTTGHFICKLCNWSTDTKNSILSHLHNSHLTSTSDQSPPIIVPSKPKKSTKQPLNQAMFDKYIDTQQTDGKLKLTCKLCERTYAQNSYALYHMRKSHPEIFGEDKFQCNICYRLFSVESELKEHLATGHTKIKSFLCSQCPYVTTVESHFKRHGATHNELDKHIMLTPNGWFGCKLCSEEAYENRRGVVRHLSTCHPTELGQEGYQCHLCHRAFGSRRGFESHVNTKHGSSQPFPCDVCEQGFSTQARLAYHQKCHKTPKVKRKVKKDPKICTQCGLTFAVKAALNKHVRKFHSELKSALSDGSKTKLCVHCGLSCVNLRAFKLHLREMHPELYKYKCEECDAIYVTNCNLQTHIKTVHLQEKVECSQCFKHYSIASMREHLKVFCKGPNQNLN